MVLSYSLVPSLPAHDKEELLRLAAALRGVATGFQIDLVDGKFVTATSWPFQNESRPVVEALLDVAILAPDYVLEFDCMVCDPEQYFSAFTAVGAKRVIIHIGSTAAIEDSIAAARSFGLSVGIALTNEVPLSELHPLIPLVDFVQLMGIAVVGAQGQPFDERTLPRAAQLRAAYPELELAVDGSVNETTIPQLLAAGINRFAPGSAIAKSEDPVAAYRALVALLSN